MVSNIPAERHDRAGHDKSIHIVSLLIIPRSAGMDKRLVSLAPNSTGDFSNVDISDVLYFLFSARKVWTAGCGRFEFHKPSMSSDSFS